MRFRIYARRPVRIYLFQRQLRLCKALDFLRVAHVVVSLKGFGYETPEFRCFLGILPFAYYHKLFNEHWHLPWIFTCSFSIARRSKTCVAAKSAARLSPI